MKKFFGFVAIILLACAAKPASLPLFRYLERSKSNIGIRVYRMMQ